MLPCSMSRKALPHWASVSAAASGSSAYGDYPERLEREYDLDLITTAPTVVYEVETTSGEIVYVDSPSKLPPLNNIEELREPIAECHMLLPQQYLGNVITLCIEKRGVQTNMVYHGNQVALTYEIPMAEVVLDFFDRLKSTSRGYASLDYNFKRFRASDMVRVDILINSERVDALALITHRDNSMYRGRELVEKMKDLIRVSSLISRSGCHWYAYYCAFNSETAA